MKKETLKIKYLPTSYYNEDHVFLGEFWVEEQSRIAILAETEKQDLKNWSYAVQIGESTDYLFRNDKA